MRGKTHCAVGIITGIQLSLIFSQPIIPTTIVSSAVFSTLPDLDKSNSIISGIILKKNFSKFLYKLILFFLDIAIFLVSIKISSSFFISAFITFFTIIFLEKKITHYNMRKALITGTLFLLSIILFLAKVNLSFIIPFIIFSIFPWLRHRNFSHSFFMVIIVYLIMKPISILIDYEFLAFLSSFMYLLHIICDMFTRQGVAIFYPFSKNMISLGYIKVGGKFSNIIENLIIFILFIVTIHLMLKFL
ncbi:metal-dependent hydrolase [Peptacetobacter sp.]|uniref:metal-dependent hydrolase n=1 Tax=Peptacetobacter sp. TaxID=2991975 RepID=UPI0026081C5D|nr:metal-dependent hydrolase [Peptacetobacter sp.]